MSVEEYRMVDIVNAIGVDTAENGPFKLLGAKTGVQVMN
jgi:hypothetical protein